MGPHSGYHAFLMFLGVFGGAAIYFSLFIWRTSSYSLPDIKTWRDYAKFSFESRLTGLLIGIAVMIWVLFIGWLW